MSEIVTLLISSITNFALGSGMTLVVVLLVLRFLFMHPENFDKWIAIFDRFLLRVSSNIPIRPIVVLWHLLFKM